MSGSLIPYNVVREHEEKRGYNFDPRLLIQPALPKMIPAKRPILRDDMDGQYQRLADFVGVNNYSMQMQRLETLLADNSMGFYNIADVGAHLVKQKPKDKIWSWKPIRQSDMETLGVGSAAYSDGDYTGQLYSRPLPITVLALIAGIEGVIPDTFAYVASDFVSPMPRPDPFLAVAAKKFKNEPWRVIFHWDEPDFKGGFQSKGNIGT